MILIIIISSLEKSRGVDVAFLIFNNQLPLHLPLSYWDYSTHFREDLCHRKVYFYSLTKHLFKFEFEN